MAFLDIFLQGAELLTSYTAFFDIYAFLDATSSASYYIFILDAFYAPNYLAATSNNTFYDVSIFIS